MNELMNKEIKMTSRELAEITGKRHDNIMRDIRNEIIALGEEGQLIFEETLFMDQCNRSQPQYSFGRPGAMQLALKYDAKTRRKVIIKLEDLERNNQPTGEALVAIALIEAHKVMERQKEQIEEMKPKAEYFDALVDRNLLTNLRDTAKEPEISQQKFVNWLLAQGYLYRDLKKKLKPYSKHTPKLFKLKEFERYGHADTQTLITPEGRETFRLLLKSCQLI